MGKTVKTTRNYKASNSVRASKAALSAQRAQNYAVRKAAQAKKIGINKLSANIKATGQAVSSVTTPFAAQRTVKVYSEQKSARDVAKTNNISAVSALDEWKSIMGGNPDDSTGQTGSSQKGSTSILD